MRKFLFTSLFLTLGVFLFFFNSSPAQAACSPTTYLSTLGGATALSYRNGAGVCTNGTYTNFWHAWVTSTSADNGKSVPSGCQYTYFQNAGCSGTTAGYGLCGSTTVSCTAPLPNCDSGPLSPGACQASCTQTLNYTTYSGGGSCTPVSSGSTQACTGGSCTAACGPVGTTQCWNGATGYCDTSHLYYQTCTAAGWSNSSNCPAGEYPYAFGTGGAGCTKPCGGHGTESCQPSASCANPVPNLTTYTNPNYAGCSAGSVCCGAATPAVCTTCYTCNAGSCDGPHSITSGTCATNGYEFGDQTSCTSSCGGTIPQPPSSAAPWYQSVGGDVRKDDGISVDLPAGQYFSVSQASPTLDAGVIFTAQPSASFGSGNPNQYNWLAKNTSFSPVPPGIKTSYAYVDANATKLGTPPTSITAFPASLTSGNYLYKTSGDLNLSGTDFAFPANGTYVFLVNGNLTINQNLIVPNGSIAIFIVKGDITVGAGVTNLQGIYSADGQFKFDTGGSRTDTQLTVQGSIIGNANLQTVTPFVNLRDLGDVANATTPGVKVVFRPDFVLHVPDFIKKPSYSVSEIAPAGN